LLQLHQTIANCVRTPNHCSTQKSCNAALLIRERTLEQGHDPRDFVVYAFGGAGPVHAFGFADELQVKAVVVPLGNGASTLSAFGIAAADTIRYFESECTLRSPFDVGELARVVQAAEDAALHAVGGRDKVIAVERSALMRYVGQQYQSLTVPIPDGSVDAATTAAVLSGFETEYERLYGAGAKIVFQSAEVFTIRIKIVGEAALDPRKKQSGGPHTGFKAPTQFVEHAAPSPYRRQRLRTLLHSGNDDGGQRVTECTCNKLGHHTSVDEWHVARQHHCEVVRCPPQSGDDSAERTLIGVQISEMHHSVGLAESSLASHRGDLRAPRFAKCCGAYGEHRPFTERIERRLVGSQSPRPAACEQCAGESGTSHSSQSCEGSLGGHEGSH
jgi:hypothetical protein